jgi:hypothetical protein
VYHVEQQDVWHVPSEPLQGASGSFISFGLIFDPYGSPNPWRRSRCDCKTCPVRLSQTAHTNGAVRMYVPMYKGSVRQPKSAVSKEPRNEQGRIGRNFAVQLVPKQSIACAKHTPREPIEEADRRPALRPYKRCVWMRHRGAVSAEPYASQCRNNRGLGSTHRIQRRVHSSTRVGALQQMMHGSTLC